MGIDLTRRCAERGRVDFGIHVYFDQVNVTNSHQTEISFCSAKNLAFALFPSMPLLQVGEVLFARYKSTLDVNFDVGKCCLGIVKIL